MSSYYWIKLYHEILDDPKMGRLPDRLWRRYIELALIASAMWEADGTLPGLWYIARDLGMPEHEIRQDLIHLQARGFVKIRPGGETPPPPANGLYTGYDILTIDWGNFGWYIPSFYHFGVSGDYDPAWVSTRLEVLTRDNRICQYCGRQANAVDHIVPRCAGGSNDLDNLVATCKSCNSRKGGRMPQEAGMEFYNAPMA